MGKYQNRFSGVQPWVFYVVILSVCASSISCTPLRKKFIRQKKKDAQRADFIPVLNPIDYEPAYYSPQERYAHHFSLWRVWHKDLVQSLGGKTWDKRVKYLLTQEMTQLQEMQKWLPPVKQEELEVILMKLNEIYTEFEEEPAAMRNIKTIERELGRISRDVRNNFNPKMLETMLIEAR